MWGRRKQHRLELLSKPPNSPTIPASSKDTGSSSPKGQLCRQFTFDQIRSATKDFKERIGTKEFGRVYKGTIKNGTQIIVAVKQWSFFARKFDAEVDLLPMLRHPNIVGLIGYCTDEHLTVYEYMSNGSLEDHLHRHRTPLSWTQRLKICIDAAHALDYLHTGRSGQVVIHGNVKSSKIMLDNQWAAKMSDFGSSKTIPMDSQYNHVRTDVTGVSGYLDPEYHISMKSDVFSFGVVLLEVLCRRSRIGWDRDFIRQGNLESIIDPELRGQISRNCLNDCARIIKCCLRGRAMARITMTEVLFGLKSILALLWRIEDLIPQLGITTSDRRLQKYFFSSRQNSGGSYSTKDSRRLSLKALRHKEDSVSETDVDAIDVFGDQTESLYELMRLEYIQRARGWMRMKDFLHLIWFYPVKKEVEVNFGSLVDKISSLNEYLSKSVDYLRDGNYWMTIQTLLHDIEEQMNGSAFDIVAYLPIGLVQNKSESVEIQNLATEANSQQVPFTGFWSGIQEVHASAVASATHRAVGCIMDLKVKKLGISGFGAEKVADTMKDMPELRRAFNMVLCVRVKHYDIRKLLKDIKVEMHLWRKRSSEAGNNKILWNQFLNCLLFIDCIDGFIDLQELGFSLSDLFGSVQIVMTSASQYAHYPVDMEIKVEDHLLPWVLFSTNVDLATVGRYSIIQQMATHLIEKCHGHLLAVILLARALRGVFDVSAWELALLELGSQLQEPSSPHLSVASNVMVRVLRFIWFRMKTLHQKCIIQFAKHCIGTAVDKVVLINSWIGDGLVKTEQEGVEVFQDLIRSFHLEQVGENSVRMRDETRAILLAYFVPRAYGLNVKQDGAESNRVLNVQEWDAQEVHLSNNIISELPNNPYCPILVNLSLHFNQNLMDIPVTFFNNMPSLQALDLSSTSIKCLPSSISTLTNLRKLFLRDCVLLIELPPEIGALKNLKVFDSERTQLICLPEQFGLLTNLEYLKFSLYNLANKHKQNDPGMQIIPAAVLSKLIRLKELSICMDLYGEWWEDEVKRIIKILPNFRNLEFLRLYFPTTELLEIFMETQNWRGFSTYQHLSNFTFIVGQLQQRLIHRVPRDLAKTFVKLPKCLKYTNGEGDKEVIARVLKHASTLFLDRHWTARSLSAFGLEEMKKLKFCLLAECNEMLEIVNGSHLEDSSQRPVLESLEHLSIHYMTSLTCILNGRVHNVCLPNLKTLAMHSCRGLMTIFTQGLLNSLTCLEYLIVEDCAKIKSLVSLESNQSTSTPSLPSLKMISLVDLPKLVSISHGISIAPKLESLVVYDCPNLEKLPYMEDSDCMREIKGDNEWWDALKWCEPEWISGQPDYLARVFIPLGTDGDIVDELADAVNLLPHYN